MITALLLVTGNGEKDREKYEMRMATGYGNRINFEHGVR